MVEAGPLEALDRVGLTLDRMAITRTEQGARKASIDDLLCFAAALEVPPWHLLIPDDPDAPMRVGSTAATAGQVGAWLVGIGRCRDGSGALAVGHGFTRPVSRGAGAAHAGGSRREGRDGG